MSPAEILAALLLVNLAGGAAILLVLLARRPVRAAFGPGLAYGLWLAAPIAVAAALAPARKIVVHYLVQASSAPPNAVDAAAMVAGPPPADLRLWLLALWVAGIALSAAVLVWRQRRLLLSAGRLGLTADRWMRRAAEPSVGPAVVGAFDPHVVVPSDFEDRFDAEERVLVLAHEWAHLKRQDARVNALVALLQCAFWFNPLVHLAARAIRMDQELACDAAVIAQFPEARRRYAEAMLKTQLTTTPLPFGCYWPARSVEPLKERIAMLKLKTPGPRQRLAGGGLIAALVLGAGFAAWAAKPAEVVLEAQVAAEPAPMAVFAANAVAPLALAPAAPAAPAKPPRSAKLPHLQPPIILAEALQPPPPPAPPAPPAPPTAPRVAPRAFVAPNPQMKIRCKVAANGQVESCRMPGGAAQPGEVEVPLMFATPSVQAFDHDFFRDRQVLIERGRAEAERGRAEGERARARAMIQLDKDKMGKARIAHIDAGQLRELARKQGDLERNLAQLESRQAGASEIATARRATDANRAALEEESQRIAQEAAKFGAQVHIQTPWPTAPAPIAPRAPRAPAAPVAPQAPRP